MSTTVRPGNGRRYLTLEQAAEHSALSTSTLRRAIRRGALHAYRPTGRRLLLDAGELATWIESAEVKGPDAES